MRGLRGQFDGLGVTADLPSRHELFPAREKGLTSWRFGSRAKSGRAELPSFEFLDALNFTFVRNFVVLAVVFGGLRGGADPQGLRNSWKKDTASPVSEPGVCFTGGMDQGGCEKEGRGLACE